MTTTLILLGLIAVLVDLLDTVYPAIPGLGLMFDDTWLLAYTSNYQIYGTDTLVSIDTVIASGMAMDYVSGALGVKYTGVSKQALWDAFISGTTDTFLSLPGLLLDSLVGVGVGEFIARQDMSQAGKVNLGMFIGFIVGMITKVGCVSVIVLTLLSVRIFNLSARP